jgi:hypothetical protein
LAEQLRREFIVCQAAGYPDPYSPWPNTRENSERFAAEHRRSPKYPATVMTRLVSEWVELREGRVTSQPDKVGERPVSHRENTWTLLVSGGAIVGYRAGQNTIWLRSPRMEAVPVEVVSSGWRERAERAEAGRDEARALALQLAKAYFMPVTTLYEREQRAEALAECAARVRTALADNESRDDG